MEWEIKKGSNGCLLCNKELSEGEEYYSALFDENKTFIRKDFCALCWDKGKEGREFSFWKTRIDHRGDVATPKLSIPGLRSSEHCKLSRPDIRQTFSSM